MKHRLVVMSSCFKPLGVGRLEQCHGRVDFGLQFQQRPYVLGTEDVLAARFKLFAHVLDFFAAMFRIRDGKAIGPGGERAEKAWAQLNALSPG